MIDLESLINELISEGVMTSAQHDRILAEIHRDGRIDSHESELLSRLFNAVSLGRLKIVDTDAEKKKLRDANSAAQLNEQARAEHSKERQNSIAINEAIEVAISRGSISQAEHDKIMRLVHSDGKIDQTEKELLSRLFAAVRNGTVVINDSSRADLDATSSRVLASRKQAAIENDIERTSPKKVPVSAELPIENPDPLPQVEKPLDSLETAVQTQPRTEPELKSPAISAQQDSSSDTYLAFMSSFGKPCLPRDSGKPFELRNDRLLDVKLAGNVWIKTGSMVGYYGSIKFSREGIFEHGLKKLIKKATTGEGATLSKATGHGNLYLADLGKKVSVVDLRGQAIVVSGQSILAFEESIEWDIQFLKQFAAMAVGGLFNVRLNGMGMVAIASHFDPVVLRVTPGQPVNTDYHATVAWSGGVAPQVRADISSQTLIGRASGETLQMQFHGDGFVIIQPFEERQLGDSEN